MIKKYKTAAGIELTEEQSKLVASFTRLMKKWDKNICINAISGRLTLMLLGDADQNPISEISDEQGFNRDNIIEGLDFTDISSDGGGW